MTLVKFTAVYRTRAPQAEHRSSIGASPQESDIATGVAVRELQSDNLYVESLRRLGISDREMRFVQVDATNLHPLQVRAQLFRNRHYSRAYSSCGPEHRNRDGDRGRILRKRLSGREGPVSNQMPHESFCPSRATC